VAAVTDLLKQVMDQIGRQFPVPLETLSLLPFVLVGTVDEIIDQLQAHRSRYGISYFLVFDQYMEQFAPVVSALTGK
jgi:alkanesulfonate monooxygenase SsuD/methylene tetrahydromethanopterin reductase-like flavin-dependent oxidoreductase (luciferase family)